MTARPTTLTLAGLALLAAAQMAILGAIWAKQAANSEPTTPPATVAADGDGRADPAEADNAETAALRSFEARLKSGEVDLFAQPKGATGRAAPTHGPGSGPRIAVDRGNAKRTELEASLRHFAIEQRYARFFLTHRIAPETRARVVNLLAGFETANAAQTKADQADALAGELGSELAEQLASYARNYRNLPAAQEYLDRAEALGYETKAHPVDELASWLEAARTPDGKIDLMRLRASAAGQLSGNELARLEAVAQKP